MTPVKSIIKLLYFSIHRRHLFGQFRQFGQCILNIVYVFHLDKLIELANESAFWIFVKIHCIRSNMLLFSRLIPVTFVIWKHSIVPFLRIHLLLCFVFFAVPAGPCCFYVYSCLFFSFIRSLTLIKMVHWGRWLFSVTFFRSVASVYLFILMMCAHFFFFFHLAFIPTLCHIHLVHCAFIALQTSLVRLIYVLHHIPNSVPRVWYIRLHKNYGQNFDWFGQR